MPASLNVLSMISIPIMLHHHICRIAQCKIHQAQTSRSETSTGELPAAPYKPSCPLCLCPLAVATLKAECCCAASQGLKIQGSNLAQDPLEALKSKTSSCCHNKSVAVSNQL